MGAGAPPQGGPGQRRFTPQELAALGRYGDRIVAHLTPGEIEVPPQVQTPQLLHALNKAFAQAHVSPQQFTAGSPQSSVNPQTGVPEYNFFASLLPLLGGLAGSFVAPELLPALAPALAGAVGGGLGTFAGGLAGGKSIPQSLLSGALGGAGSYAGASLFPTATLGSLTGASGGAPMAGMPMDVGAQAATQGLDSSTLGSAAGMAANAGSGTGALGSGGASMLANNVGIMGMNYPAMMGGALGSAAGNYMGRPGNTANPYPPGFNTPMTPVGQLPSAQTQLGQNVSKSPPANFTGFNPYQAGMTGGYNFFPTATNGQ